MADLLYVGIMVAFFSLAALAVAGCERILGSTSEYEGAPAEPAAAPAAAPAPQPGVAA